MLRNGLCNLGIFSTDRNRNDAAVRIISQPKDLTALTVCPADLISIDAPKTTNTVRSIAIKLLLQSIDRFVTTKPR